MSAQATLTQTLYVYECPVECTQYWDANPHLDPDDDETTTRLYCERCGRACRRTGSFDYDPFTMTGFPDEEAQ